MFDLLIIVVVALVALRILNSTVSFLFKPVFSLKDKISSTKNPFNNVLAIPVDKKTNETLGVFDAPDIGVLTDVVIAKVALTTAKGTKAIKSYFTTPKKSSRKKVVYVKVSLKDLLG